MVRPGCTQCAQAAHARRALGLVVAMPRSCRGHAPVVSWPCRSPCTAVSWPISRHIAVSQAPLLVTIQILYRNLAPTTCRIAALVVLYRDTASDHTFSAPLSQYNQLYRDTPSQTVHSCCYVTIQCFVLRPHSNGQAMRVRSPPCRAHSRPYCSLPLGRVVVQSSRIVAEPAWPCTPCVTIQSTVS